MFIYRIILLTYYNKENHEKVILIIALLPAFAFAQNAVVSVMPGYSFASKMQGPALRVNYSQAWKGKSGYSQHWSWQVGLACYNGAEKEVDFEPFQDQAFATCCRWALESNSSWANAGKQKPMFLPVLFIIIPLSKVPHATFRLSKVLFS